MPFADSVDAAAVSAADAAEASLALARHGVYAMTRNLA